MSTPIGRQQGDDLPLPQDWDEFNE